MSDKPTEWTLYECGGGSRFASAHFNHAGEICTFSGCNCRTKVREVKKTTDRNEAASWFRRPKGNDRQGNGKR